MLPDNGLDDEEPLDEEEEDDGSLVWPTLTLPPPLRYQHRGPFFEQHEFPSNVTVTAGQTVLLQCRVIDLADRVVCNPLSSLSLCCSILATNGA